MDFGSFLGVLRRRWLVVGACLVLSAVVAMAALGLVKPTYSSSASLALLAPPKVPSSTGDVPENPYLQFGSGIENMATIMQEAFLDPGLSRSLADRGATGA